LRGSSPALSSQRSVSEGEARVPNATKTLITGGGGFIGAHVAEELLREGQHVRVLDAMLSQVHADATRPDYLSTDVELVRGDVRDPDAVCRALAGVDRVAHFAARVGVGQSMYEIAEYTSVNALGTAVLLEALVDRPVEQLVVASSMSVYGEGLYTDSDGNPVDSVSRRRADLQAGLWEPRAADGGSALIPVPTPETKPVSLSSVYALNKFDQERLCLLFGEAYQVPTTALRFFNVYGRHQALSNPYTGVLAIFAARLLNDRRPLLFEDGEQRRDFVHVTDVARACRLALSGATPSGEVVNVGSGRNVSINEVAHGLAHIVGKEHLTPETTGKYRVGDIRHCFADISKAQRLWGFEPLVGLDEGLRDLADWLEGQVAIDSVEEAARALASRGLTV
jgi:dTDP-L-rhamnose 4-epimerase